MPELFFAPYNKFLSLCDDMEKLIKDKNAFGPDQIILNYYLYQKGFIFLDSKYNFMMSTEEKGFVVKKACFINLVGKKLLLSIMPDRWIF